MRITNSKTQSKIWRVIMIRDGVEFVNKDFSTLTEIATEYNLTYHQVAELGDKNGRVKKAQSKFKFYPEISIKRIKQTQKEYYNQKRYERECEIFRNILID
tara:strand:+ start:220 stop:522 length:303 start_codon:yes stop_codon:yes gene_type:complete